MINKRLIAQLKKTNEDIAKHFEAIGKLSDDQYNEIVKIDSSLAGYSDSKFEESTA